jgi:hypothetical protein
MSSNTTISLNDFIITKQEEKDLVPRITMPSVNIDTARKEYTEKYEINLMWINKDKCDFLFCDEEKTKNVINIALRWAEKNPEAKIIIWYDSEFINSPETAVKNSSKLIKDKTKNEQIVFKNIRELDLVKKHESVFSNELPVYFRADLLREIIIFEVLNNNKTNCFVYTDIDIKPMTKKQLFDDETVYHLKKYGFILARTAKGNVENGFQMIVKNDIAIKAIKDILIDFPITLAESYLNPSEEQLNLKSKHNNIYEKKLPELIFYTFRQMFKYFYFLKNKIIAKKDICSDIIIKKAIEEFWNEKNIFDGELNIPWRKILSGELIKGFNWFYPTKIVAYPPVSDEYY